MASLSEVASGGTEMVDIEIRAELRMNPLEFLPLAERKTILLTGRRPTWEADFPMCGIDMAAKERAPRFFLEIFTKELTRALHQSNPAGYQKRKFAEPAEEKTGLLTDFIFRKERLDGAKKNTVSVNLEEGQMSLRIAIKVEDSSQYKDCSSLDSQGNTSEEQSPGVMDANCVCAETSANQMCLGACQSEVLTPKIKREIDEEEDLVDTSFGTNTICSHLVSSKGLSSCHVDGLFTDFALLTSHSVVKDEPLEGSDVPFTFETNSRKRFRKSIERCSDSRKCQNTSPGRVSSLKHMQETASSFSEINDPANTQLQRSRRDRISHLATGDLSFSSFANTRVLTSDPWKSEAKSEDSELSFDVLDLMRLSERIRLLKATTAPDLDSAGKYRCFKQAQEHSRKESDLETSARRRKWKKTATDSVEVALEEDAPGLLQGLLDRGIHLSEIRLYGCEEDDYCTADENSFEDLEVVMHKIFSAKPISLVKLNLLRQGKGTKAIYCLACLISLIEQARYLQFRKCPVEWGWCRDLQSFIFVFEMHNRIVLERPEYGYATYFFELVGCNSIAWQIRRLVVALKLATCGRVSLIENRPLRVGEDISEGEACVLEEYGWRRNSGLGSMLNYCDRVVHDRTQEYYISDWRRKIGKLLMNGYDGGRIVITHKSEPVLEDCTEVKLETYT